MPDFYVASNEVKLRAQAETLLCAPAVLLKMERLSDCMEDENVRAYFGRVMQNELMPALPLERRSEIVILTCRMLENKALSPKADDLINDLLERFSLLLCPLISKDTPGLSFSLACLIMLLAGVKPLQTGYEAIGSKGAKIVLNKNEEALKFFSRLSGDMPSDSLCYAVLKDETLFGRTLYELDGLPDMVENMLRDIQIMGPLSALILQTK